MKKHLILKGSKKNTENRPKSVCFTSQSFNSPYFSNFPRDGQNFNPLLRAIIAGILLSTFFLWPISASARNLSSSEKASTEFLIQRIVDLARPLLEDVPAFQLHLKADFRHPTEISEPRVSFSPSENYHANFTIFRNGDQEWGIRLTSSWRNFALHWTATMSALILPDALVCFTGRGEILKPSDSLIPKGFLGRFITPETSLSSLMALMNSSSLDYAIRLFIIPKLTQLNPESVKPGEFLYQLGENLTISLNATGTPRIRIKAEDSSHNMYWLNFLEISLDPRPYKTLPASWTSPLIAETEVPRHDLEKMIFRGMKRILSIKLPGVRRGLEAKKVAHGELRNQKNQMLVLLSGTPEQIGKAHGLLLSQWNRMLVDSTIYLVGLVETISGAKWFFNDLENAWTRLSPHIPSDIHREMEALASASPDVSLREVRLSNIFPEYFHCSGFALFGRATSNGVLYHGRVLDYMTLIGLQDTAVSFVIRPRNKRAFFSPGFAGIVGSVGGMNEKQISIGEMGGRGRYQWDGIPMSILVRRALQECDTLEQVKSLWRKGPRTCEYFFVFADGKIPDAVALRATPNLTFFLGSGESHEFLGEGISDAVVLSGGKRLKLLRKRVKEGYGNFNASSALRLMDRPVSMVSNLHNVLFVPQQQDVYVAIAAPLEPAADQPYVKYNLKELLLSFP